MTRTAWFHCFAGTAGDMTLGALVHAGADPTEVMATLGGLGIDGYALTFEPVLRCGIAATHAIVVTHDEHGDHHDHDHHDHDHHDHDHEHDHGPHRPYRLIRELLDTADLPARVRERAQRTFRVLAEVEGRMHRMDPDDVEFHEAGAVDAIVDVVGACAALEVLGIDRIVCSPITVGQGHVHAAHGQLPNPAPAVVDLLALRQAPSRGIDDHRELATPTGVALMVALADEFGPMPAMHIQSVGYGAGTRDITGRPNVVQVVVGESVAASPGPGQPVELLECNVDDVTGEVLAHTIVRLLDAGAHDAWASPIVMKKGRPAHTVHALCDPALVDAVRAVMVAETGTLGVRGSTMHRWPLERRTEVVDVEGHAVRIKVATDGTGSTRLKVEHDDAAAAAAALGLPLREVIERAQASASATRSAMPA
ncbi:MAG: nickel pincer cofactor biosynthesis protein LarC [Actinobacteria bacterium]|nr:nickel pincer cofactor biosynthesis protein LarC [Actinomycetota bacterium]